MDEKDMDTANNKKGAIEEKRLGNKFSESTLIDDFKDLLKEGKLKVLKSRRKLGEKN